MSHSPQSLSGRKPVVLEDGTEARAIINFFNSVYAWMCVALAVTGISAWLTSLNLEALSFLYNRGVSVVMMLGLVLMVFAVRNAAYRLPPVVSTALFLLYAALVGMAISGIFVVYQLSSIFSVFVITAGMFGSISTYGFITRRDLTGIGSICLMACVGLFLAAIVNVLLGSAMISWLISFVGVFIFAGLTAYDTQKLRGIAEQTAGNSALAARMAVLGSLELYLDFLNLFLMLLRLMGDRK